MFSTFLKNEPRNLYIGTLAVAPDDNLASLESFFGFSDLDDSIRDQLSQIFAFQKFSEVTELSTSDLILDVIVVGNRGGDMFTLNFDGFGLPMFWRPKIKLVSRIYNAKSNKTLKVFKVSESVTWREYFGRILSFRGIFRFGPLFSGKDMESILGRASINLLGQVKKWMK
jgi:hypothetical protein